MDRRLFSAAALSALFLAAPAFANDRLTPRQAGEVVDRLVAALDSYFDPVVAKKVQAVLVAKRANYARIADREALAAALSTDTLAASGDLHLRVQVATTSATAERLTDAEQDLVDQRLAYGLMAARRLPGNIGYLKLRYFEQTAAGAAMIDSAMGLLRHTDALILDLRENTGGGGRADARLLGHLSTTPLAMEAIHWRQPNGEIQIEQRSVDQEPGPALYDGKPVYVLTAKRTFSAAEAFAYTLKASKRAVLIGQTTRGGGNPANRPSPSLGYGLTVFVPNGWVVHPLTGGGWEGKGVTPDVATAPDAALTEAFRQALIAAKPLVSTPKSEKERADAMASPAAALAADQPL